MPGSDGRVQVDQTLARTHTKPKRKRAKQELTVRHDELGDKIDVVVTEATKLGLLGLGFLVKQLKKLGQRGDGCALASIVVVAIHMQDLLAVH